MREQAEELLPLPATAGVSEPQAGPWCSWFGCCKCRGAAQIAPPGRPAELELKVSGVHASTHLPTVRCVLQSVGFQPHFSLKHHSDGLIFFSLYGIKSSCECCFLWPPSGGSLQLFWTRWKGSCSPILTYRQSFSCLVSIPVPPLHSPGNEQRCLARRGSSENDLVWACGFFKLLHVLPNRCGCLYSRDPDSAYPHLLSK